MPNPRKDLHALFAVQVVDNKIKKVHDALAALDDGSQFADAYNQRKAEFDRLKSTALKAETNQKDAELRLQSIDAKMVQVNKTLYGGTVTAARELENLQRELDMLERQRSDAEETVLISMETATVALAKAREHEAYLMALATKYKEVRALFKKESATFKKELDGYQAERTDAAKHVPQDLLTKYDAVRKRRDGIGIVYMLDNGACGGCYTLLSKGLASAIRTGESVEVCEFCGRFLALPSAES
ncbi:MAG: hypothetical protein OHK0029_09040 [Armatimonadaceae bacterium]